MHLDLEESLSPPALDLTPLTHLQPIRRGVVTLATELVHSGLLQLETAFRQLPSGAP